MKATIMFILSPLMLIGIVVGVVWGSFYLGCYAGFSWFENTFVELGKNANNSCKP